MVYTRLSDTNWNQAAELSLSGKYLVDRLSGQSTQKFPESYSSAANWNHNMNNTLQSITYQSTSSLGLLFWHTSDDHLEQAQWIHFPHFFSLWIKVYLSIVFVSVYIWTLAFGVWEYEIFLYRTVRWQRHILHFLLNMESIILH